MNAEKSLGSVLTETREEIKDFIETRFRLLRAELAEKLITFKYSIPLLAAAAGLLLFGFITLTFTFVSLIHVWFLPGPYAWMWGGLIVAVIYLLAGAAVGAVAYSQLRSIGVAPKRTLQVLKQDQVWIQKEARTT